MDKHFWFNLACCMILNEPFNLYASHFSPLQNDDNISLWGFYEAVVMGIKPGTEDTSGNGKYPDFACKLLNHVNIFSCFCNFTFFKEFFSFCQQTCLDTPFPNSPLVKFTKISAVMGVFIELGLPGGLAGWRGVRPRTGSMRLICGHPRATASKLAHLAGSDCRNLGEG